MHVLVHGGAGGAPREPAARQKVLDEAVSDGLEAATPIEAVKAAVRCLEDSPRFNAGTGGTIQSDGIYRSDAGIMTDDGSIGAVCNLTGIRHPVDLADSVRTELPHIFLGPAGAMAFAEHLGIDTGYDLSTDRLTERFEAEGVPADFAGQLRFISERFDAPRPSDDLDTVGAVATDGETLAAATSTGGRWLALRGRIGDVPQVGCGYYASPAGAVSTTGNGEAIAQVTLARLVERQLERGHEVQQAVTEAMATFERETDATAGVIAITAAGEIGSAYNSARMQTAAGSRR